MFEHPLFGLLRREGRCRGRKHAGRGAPRAPAPRSGTPEDMANLVNWLAVGETQKKVPKAGRIEDVGVEQRREKGHGLLQAEVLIEGG